MFVKPDKNLMSPCGILSADASSIIYLSKIEMIDYYCRFKKLIISDLIFNELQNNKYYEIFKYNYLFSHKIIGVVKTDNHVLRVNNNSRTLKHEDATIISVYKRKKAQGVLSDDGKVCSYCQASGIPFFNTPMALFSMAVDGMVSYNDFIEKLDMVYQIGRFSEKIRTYLENLIEAYFDNV